MFYLVKKIFYNPTKETIDIFEEKTKVSYEPSIFKYFEVLSLNNSRLSYLKPLSVFVNLKILNLSKNNIKDISYLENLTKLKILDLRFNEIEKIPSWVFERNIPIYWERTNDTQEGIYLEGNPLDKELISKIKNDIQEEVSYPPLSVAQEESPPLKSIELEQLIPLKRGAITIITPQSHLSNFINSFENYNINSEFKLNISKIEYNDNSTKLDGIFYEIKYIILIVIECCLHLPILELLSKLYSRSEIFLIIENSNKEIIQKKINFFKTYNNIINIIEIYHSFDEKSNDFINKEIYKYLNKTQESNSLWKKNWIELRDEIENSKISDISFKEFQTLADKYHIDFEVQKEIFAYLQRVGTITKSPYR